MKKSISIYVVLLLLLVATFSPPAVGQSSRLPAERPYEPVVLRGGVLSAFFTYPVDEVFLYAYDSATQSWRMMPFQIDERIRAADPNNEENLRHTYFLPDDGLIDDDDELVFMVRDMGDQAPEKGWIDNPESKAYQRLELRGYDPDDASLDAYAYLFRSATIIEPVPTPYEFSYDLDADQVESKYYMVGLDKVVGLVEDIKIKPPFGSGTDIFDRQKLRATADLSISGFEIPFTAQQELLLKLVSVSKDSNHVMAKPVVRYIREARQTFRLGPKQLENAMTFYVNAKFYPFNGRVIGGSALDTESLKRAMPGSEDLWINFTHLRQSWDLNANAAGMLFYNKRNAGVVIDGKPDAVDYKIDRPVREWNLVTGAQGALFTMTSLPDTVAKSISLYFYDNKAGGTGDPDSLYYYDTGDGASYGDFGLSMWGAKSLELSFEMYFLPNSVNTSAQAEKIAHAVEKPVWINYRATGVAGRPADFFPESFTLAQNHPNPFNQETRIAFSLPRAEGILLQIFDAQGRLVRKLADGTYAAGEHRVNWDGRDESGAALASGIYFYQLSGENRAARHKLLLLR